jgi:(E)-4-hydroxy-3-methylbut-2-enyl-diphosphate synthase
VQNRIANTVRIGGFGNTEAVLIGGPAAGRINPVVIQTMWKDRLSFSDLEGEAGERVRSRIAALRAMGCGLLRFAVPDIAAAEALGSLAEQLSASPGAPLPAAMPLVADIHFDYKIALRCLDFPIAKIRINPGNIGSRERVEQVLSKAAAKAVPVRIGVNAGSLPQDLRRRVDEGMDRAEALVEAAERELAIFKEFDFPDVIVSMKASSIAETIRANTLLASRTNVPLHIGVTEAGPLVAGVVRNTAALLSLLSDGIGDTIRVSLSDTMENEVIAAREILGAAADMAGKERHGITLVSCPRCGRHDFDTHGFTARWLERLYALDKNITVAIMGCAVNGPGEARHADLGSTGAGNKVLIFRHGEVIRTIDASEAENDKSLTAAADNAFWEELNCL